MSKIDLKDSTFIIPVKLESADRIKNAKIVLNFLQETFDTNLIIYEFQTNQVPELIEITENIDYIHEPNSDDSLPFHRTKYLNTMLKRVKTFVTVNYDVDVLLPVEAYVQSQAAIADGGYDLIFPYGVGNYQRMVNAKVKDSLIDAENIYDIMDASSSLWTAEFGHAQFFKTTSYISGGGENEEFVTYAPEDHERHYRFLKLGYKVGRLNDFPVYHLEHERGKDSVPGTIWHNANMDLYKTISEMSVFELMQYYKSKRDALNV